MRNWIVLAALLVAGLAGCLGDDAPEPEQAAESTPEPPTISNGRVQVDVPTPVYLVGFPNGTAAALAGELGAVRPDANTYNSASPTGLLAGGTGGVRSNPMDPTAVYDYIPLPAARDLIVDAGDLIIEDGFYNATAVEDLLWAHITVEGLAPAPGVSGIVLLHLGSDARSYRLHYPTGYIDGVRAFGERAPFTALDISAPVDGYVGTSNSFNEPVAIDDPALVSILADAVERATWYRTLQGPLYPQATEPCHAVTLVLAARTTTLSDTLPSYDKAEDLLDVDYLMAAWESLLGEGTVYIDADIIRLPLDDPALEAAMRGGSNAVRVWATLNWEQYHVPHDGCEAYLSFFLIGDLADSGVSGIAMYDVNDDRRVSMSNMNDLNMFQEQDGEVGVVFYQRDESRAYTDWVNFLFSHETGHLFGQRHPHDISANGGPPGGMTFASIWSAMSYQQDGKIPLFGAIDQNNFARNRLGFLIEAAGDAPEVDEALALAGQYRWTEAADLLLPVVNG